MSHRNLALVLVLVAAAGCSSSTSKESSGSTDGLVSVPMANGGLLIDATEVTRDDYKAFLASGPSSAGQRADCQGNQDFNPKNPDGLSGDGTLPVTYVDLCDAVAYCEWAGKHLCGIRGELEPHEAYSDENVNEWYRACSKAESKLYPYGGNPYDPTQVANAYRPGVCNSSELGAGGPVSVGSLPRCEGGYSGLFDMSGNVAEWTDHCETGMCAVRGGSFKDGAPDSLFSSKLECTATPYVSPETARDDLGFRCCR